MLQNQTCGVVHLKCTLFGAVREGNHGYQLSRPIPTSLSGRYRVQLHRLTSNQEFDFDPLRLRFDLEEERMVREVRIIRRLKDKCVVFCTTSMRGTLPCRKTSGLCTQYCKCHFKGKARTLPMSSSVYSISNSWLIRSNIVTNSLLKCVNIMSHNHCV